MTKAPPLAGGVELARLLRMGGAQPGVPMLSQSRLIVSFSMLFLVACSPVSQVPVAVDATLAPEIAADCSGASLPGVLSTCRLAVAQPIGGQATFSVGQGPAGLLVSLDGEVSWTPTEEQAGEHEVIFVASIDGSHAELVLTWRVQADESLGSVTLGGDTNEVNLPDPEPFEFFELSTPNGGFDGEVTVSVRRFAEGLPASILGFVLYTEVTATEAIEVTVGLTDEHLSLLGVVTTEELVLAQGADSGFELVEGVTFPDASSLRFSWLPEPGARGNPFDWAFSMFRPGHELMTQSPRICELSCQGYPVRCGGPMDLAGPRVALVVHGIAASMNDFVAPRSDLVPWLCQSGRYDRVFGFNYPSGERVSTGAMILRGEIERTGGAKDVDVYAHSMGGLVSRFAVESGLQLDGVRRIVQIATPNRGAHTLAVSLERWVPFLGAPAYDDLRQGIYTQPRQDVPIWSIAGNTGGGTDCAVEMFSAIAPAWPNRSRIFADNNGCAGFTMDQLPMMPNMGGAWYDHTALHQLMGNNGVGWQIAEWLAQEPDTEAVITADPFEPNNDINQPTNLAPGTYVGATISQGDEDWFGFSTVNTYSLVRFAINFPETQGELEIRMYRGGVLVDSAEGALGSGFVDTRYDGTEAIYVQVVGHGGVQNVGYEITVTFEGGVDFGPACSNSDDTAWTAVTAPAGTFNRLAICPSDPVDWIEIPATTGAGPITIEFEHAYGDLDMALFNSAGQELASATSTDDNETLESGSGRRFLRVSGFEGAAAPYRMIIEDR